MASKQLTRVIIAVTAIFAAIMELIDTSIVNVALAQISGNLGATIEDTSWVVTAYAIANVIIIPMTGFLARYFGRKNYYISSIILFTIASYLCGQAESLETLVLWRFIQGIGGGALLSTSQAIMFDAFDPSQRAMASGMFGMGIVLGPAIGPTLGGIIVDGYSWPLIFYINIPFGIAATFLALRFIEKKPEEHNINRKEISIDYIGISLLAVGVASLQYVLERGEHDDWFHSNGIILLTGAAICGLIGFVWWELREKAPVINLHLLRNRNLAASNILTFVCGFGLFGSVFIFPVMAQRILGYTSTEAGLSLIPGALIAVLIMPIIGRTLGTVIQPIVFVIIGFVMFILHGYTSSLATAEASRAWFILPQIFRGLGTACLTVPLINQAMVGLQPKDMGSGIALTNMLRQLGGAFGIAVMNTYISHRYVVHRTDLVSNLQMNDPEMIQRLNALAQGTAAKGVNALSTTEAGYRILEGTVTRQSYLLSYLDGFQMISIFFICAIPFMFLLRNQKVDAATKAKIAEESH
ncbi:MAG TPA: DHA2 family efflux MFS transporter permease subunit [Cytophagaceae bacterium]|nr:DHA2 family efflux MFS transporter permease subunit [Cytophagaceae bacterium]